MEFDKSRVYTALNADELKPGSKIIVANYLESLKAQVEANSYPSYVVELSQIMGTSSTNRFKVDNKTFNLAYLISKSEEKKLKWTDLKIGDIVHKKNGTKTRMVIAIDTSNEPDEEGDILHICLSDWWISDEELADWEKVE